jgi:riboflavin synthase
MFTGITEEIGRVIRAAPDGLVIGAGGTLQGMALGDSIAVNGACLTVTGCDESSFSVGVMPETLKRTNLGRLRAGDGVNLERALALGGRLGGHLVQGHVDDVGRVASVSAEGGALLLRVEAPAEVMRYIVAKGFIAVDGVSLTVVNREAAWFRVAIVDYTRRHTTLGGKRPGDPVNLEVDIIAKYVEQLSQGERPGVSADFLREHGFLVG